MAQQDRKTRAGLPLVFPASFYNDLVDVVRAYKSSKSLGQEGQAGAISSGTVRMVKNEAGLGDLPRFSCVEIESRLYKDILDHENQAAFIGIAPSGCLRPSAILLHPAKEGDLVPAAIAGGTMARVDVVEIGDKYANPVPGSSVLVSEPDGGRFRIIEPVTSTGEQSLFVTFSLQISEDCSSGASGSGSVDEACRIIPGAPEDELEIVDALPGDLVLAYRDGCLVLLRLGECDLTGSEAVDPGSEPGSGGGGEPLSIDDPTFPSMQQGIAITPFSLSASGGTTPYSFSVIAGALPAGLSLVGDTVSGTPTTPGSGSATFRVTDDVSDTADTSSRPWTVTPIGA